MSCILLQRSEDEQSNCHGVALQYDMQISWQKITETRKNMKRQRAGLTKSTLQLPAITRSQTRLLSLSILTGLAIPRTPATSRLPAITFDLSLLAKLTRHTHRPLPLLAVGVIALALILVLLQCALAASIVPAAVAIGVTVLLLLLLLLLELELTRIGIVVVEQIWILRRRHHWHTNYTRMSLDSGG
jgi:hypothetical protein